MHLVFFLLDGLRDAYPLQIRVVWKVNPSLSQVRRREQQASISKPLTEWANEFFSTESDHLNRTIVGKAETSEITASAFF